MSKELASKHRIPARALISLVTAFLVQQDCWGQIQLTPPPQASARGYTWTAFSAGPNATPFSANSVDVQATLNPGFQWFPAWFYFYTSTPPINISFPTGSGAGTAVIEATGISSMAANHPGTQSPKTESGIVGEAFGGGGYFEATFQFDPTQVIHSNGWPAWWGMAEEHLKSGSASNLSQFWEFYDTADTGDPAFAHFAETDFFEYNIGSGYYGGTMIDWYGDYSKSNAYWNIQSPWADKQLKYPPGTSYTIPHAYGFLWVPATTSSNGSATFYLDGTPFSTQVISWNQYQGQAPYTNLEVNAPSTPWSFSILDQQHIGIILNTGDGEPMTITSVNVWQANGNWNIHTGTLYDTLNNFSNAYAWTNMVIGKPNTSTPAADYNGDTAFAQRSVKVGTGTIVYNLANINTFTARVYYWSDTHPTNVTFSVSATGAAGSYYSVPTTHSTPHGTPGGWAYEDISTSSPITPGYNFLKIDIIGTTQNAWDLAIGQVRIN